MDSGERNLYDMLRLFTVIIVSLEHQTGIDVLNTLNAVDIKFF
jgi:hypothetical protein